MSQPLDTAKEYLLGTRMRLNDSGDVSLIFGIGWALVSIAESLETLVKTVGQDAGGEAGIRVGNFYTGRA